MFYKVITECGHLGAGNGYERVWFFKGHNPLSILTKARTLPRVKRKDTSLGIKLIQRISREEYVAGVMKGS
ncbi:MAG: hypothetical protein HY878_00925 [Deltaproteobacteria bacterium]|nr:hypothetical protein [Deltaproteobacteria bacterium]